MQQKPLAGIRVLDLSAVVMGPWATHCLAAHGAEVIKVEAPGGDTMRQADPCGHPGMAPIFRHSNRGKQSIVLDLKRPDARDVCLRLAAKSDVFVHNIRPAAARRLRLDWEAVSAVNQRIVYASLTGFGSSGQYAGRPAYDDLIQGASGLAAMFGDPPRYVPSLVADRYVGVYAAQMIMAALLAARSSGQGRAIEVPMFEVMAELVLADHLNGWTWDPPVGTPGYSRITNRNRRPYATSDGWISVIVYTDRHWQDFFRVAEAQAMFDSDRRLHDPTIRRASYEYAYGVIAGLLENRSTTEWLDMLAAADIPAIRLQRVEDLVDDTQIRASGIVRDVGCGERALGSAAGFIDAPAPRLGEHTRPVLATAGYSATEIDSLIAAGAVA